MNIPFNIKSTMDRKIDEFVSLSCVDTGEIKLMLGTNELRKYSMRATIGIDFWANERDFTSSQRNAQLAIKVRLYGELLKTLSRLRVAIGDGSRERAYALCDEIQQFIMKEDL